MIEILGYITAGILGLLAGFFLYHTIRGLVIGIDLMRWQLIGADWVKIRSTKRWPLQLGRVFLNCWVECMFYDGSTTYSRSNKCWSGLGTGR
jgi:hypothetical protein